MGRQEETKCRTRVAIMKEGMQEAENEGPFKTLIYIHPIQEKHCWSQLFQESAFWSHLSQLKYSPAPNSSSFWSLNRQGRPCHSPLSRYSRYSRGSIISLGLLLLADNRGDWKAAVPRGLTCYCLCCALPGSQCISYLRSSLVPYFSPAPIKSLPAGLIPASLVPVLHD